MNFSPIKNHLDSRREKIKCRGKDYQWVNQDPVVGYLSPTLYYLYKKELLDLDEISIQFSRLAYYQNEASWLLYNLEFKKILEIFYNNNIDVMPLKAFAYAEQLYPDRGVRRFSDIDLLVKTEQFLPALELLTQNNFKILDEDMDILKANINRVTEVTLITPLGVVVEIHQSILAVKNFFRYEKVHPVDLDQIWKRASKTVNAGLPMFTLSITDTLAHLCLHAGSHGLSAQSPFTYLDFDCWVRENQSIIDWREFVLRIKEWKLVSTTHHMLKLCKTIFQTPFPSDLIQQLNPGMFAKWRIRLVYSIDSYLSHDIKKLGIKQPKLVRLLLIDHFTDLVKILFEGFFPSKQFRQLVYGSPVSLFHHWQKILQKISL